MTELYKSCRLCPRECGTDRFAAKGFCGEGASLYAARAALHFWEEPPISGKNGSGAVFFCGCNLKCVYCQNEILSKSAVGREISAHKLADIFLRLENQGAHNINLVTPTHFLPHIVEAVNLAKERSLSVPIVYNTSGYESAEAIKLLYKTVDIFLTDFKYIKEETARKYSAAPDYFERTCAALEEMVKIAPEPVFDGAGIMKKGVVVRHLLLPNHLIEAKMIVKYLFSRYGDKVYISLMNQYTPIKKNPRFPELNRKVYPWEYSSLVAYASRLGVTNAFIQEYGTAKESFIPAFDLTGLSE